MPINRIQVCRRALLFVLMAANLLVSACTGPDQPARIDHTEDENEFVTLERSYDEIFSFAVLPATGPGTIPERGNTVDLLLNMPYLLTSGLIPPEFVINELLSHGLDDAGMSGGVRWDTGTGVPGHGEFEMVQADGQCRGQMET